jgi:hypothetical protein
MCPLLWKRRVCKPVCDAVCSDFWQCAMLCRQGSEIDLEDGGLQQGGIEVLPKDLCLVLRVTQMLRGLGSAAEMAGAAPTGNLAAAWRPYARRALSEPVST